ncbi:MAG: leucine-rich repeat protein [Oscillospiraceae bacterium]|nr:leucine-rich repeat protein [Oscillospiraceae bacterium]
MKMKKLLALFLCLMILGTMLPVRVFAEETADGENEPVQVEKMQTEADAETEESVNEEERAVDDNPASPETEQSMSTIEEPEPASQNDFESAYDRDVVADEAADEESPVQEDEDRALDVMEDAEATEAEAEDEEDLAEAENDDVLLFVQDTAGSAGPEGTVSYSGNWGGDNGVDWYLYENGFLDIIGHGSEIKDFSGNGIAKLAWQYHQKEIKSLRIRGVTAIGSMAFSGCSKLKTVDLEEGLWKIADWAFYNCGLENITIPRSVTTFGECPFGECPFTTAGPVGSGCDYEFPWTTEVPAYAFDNLKKLTGVALPESIVSIGAAAFRYCNSLTAISLPKGLKNLGGSAFSQCYNLSEIIIPDGIQVIDDYLFYRCTSLKDVRIPNGITSVGQHAFDGCISLKDVDLPDSITNIGLSAFYGCSGLKHFEIPSGVTAIENNTFVNCVSLEELTVPVKVRQVGDNAFYGCDELATVYYGGIEDQWRTITIGNGNYALKDASIVYQAAFPTSISKTSLKLAAGESETLTLFDDSGLAVPDVTWSSSDSTVAKVDGSGKVSALKYGTATITGRARGKSLSCKVNALFCDVADFTTYYYDPVYWAAAKGITSGTSATNFSPTRTCTRGQIVTFLWKALGSPEPSTASNPFTDVKTTDYYYKPVLWAKEKGITSGTSATTFSPGNPCTRGQIVTFLWKALGSPEPSTTSNPFIDVKTTDYFFKPVLWAKENSITSGTSTTTFGPGNSCTRAQAMTFLYKAVSQ